MKKINMNQSKSSNLFKGKGFYITLCLSIVAVGAAGIFAYNQTADNLKGQIDSNSNAETSSTTEEWGYEDLAEDVNVPKDDVPVESTTAETEAVTTTEPAEAASTQPLIMPLNGEIINPFSNGELVKSSTLNCWKTHDGVDIQGTLGDQIKSMTSGTVTDIKEDPLWGVCVIIDHGNGLEGHYYSLSEAVLVKVDQKVSAGTVIGTIGDTAECEITEPSHLHFGVKKNGSWVDPIELINGSN